MMTIVQKPSPINLSGNLPSFIMFSDDPFNFVIKKGNISLLSGSYTPGGDRKVTIDVKDVIEFSLSFQFRDILETYTQDTLIDTFYAYINDELICNFEVIKGGISNFGMTPQTFLQQHFLTWQPREKRVSYSSPEYLTYYAVTDCRIKLKAYMSTVDAIEMVISELQQGKVYTIPVMYAVVAGKLNAYPAYYDIWVESADGSVRYSYIQRFVYEQGKSEQEEYIIFENSLGGVDCFRAYGNTVFNADNTHNIAIIDDQLNEYRIDTEYKYTKNTGYLTKYEAEWLKDFFPSTGKYIFRNNILRKIVLTEDNVSSSEQESVNSYEFTYRYADDNIYLNLPVYQNSKKLISPMSLNVDNVEKSLGLEPRLAEFPMQKLSEGSLIPVQEPFSERWNATNAGAIANYIIEKINSLTDGRLLDNRFKGYYLTETSLKESYPNPLKGDSAWVGEPFPGVVYTVENGKWKTSGKAPDFGDINLEDYATKEDLAAQDSKLTELSSEKVESYLFSKEKFSNPINGLIAVSILDLSIFYKKGYNGEKWCFDSHGIKEDGTIVLTLYNLTTKGRIEFRKNIESIEHTCLLFNYNSEDYDINFIFNPYNYLNLIPEAKSQQASGWKRLYTERKTEEYSFSESVFTDYIHDKFDTVKKEELDNATKKIEETQNEIDNINSLLLYAKPGTVEFKNEDLDFSELDKNTFNNYTYYCNEALTKDGFIKSIKVISAGATSIDVITARVIENDGNLDLILIKNYGNFSIKSEGESTVFINETQILNHKGDCVFVKFNGGNLKYKSPYYGTGYSFTSSAIQKITVRVGCTTNWIEPIYRNFINSNFGDIMTSLYGHKDTGILFTNEELDLSLYDKTSTNYNYYCNLPLKRAGKLKTILLKSDMSIQAKIGLCISGTFVCLKNYGTLTSEGGKINIDDDTVYPSGSLLFIKPLSQYYYNWAYTGFELQSDYIKPSTVNIAYTSKWEYVEYIYENIKDKIDLFIEKQNEINLSVQDYDKEEYIEVFSDYFTEKNPIG